MISDSTLKKLCFITAVVGIFCLFLLTQIIEPYSIEISNIRDSDIGKLITVKGTIVSIYSANETTFFELHDNNYKIDAVLFSRANINNSLLVENSTVYVTGRLAMYRGSAEIIVENIKEK
jgi:DNA/RNA endonuclease YhcR with UshA esterase domain